MRKRMSEEQKKEAQTPEDEVKKEAGSAEATETPEEDNAPEAENTEEKAEEKTEEKADDGNEKYVRLMAEFQNYKKRVAKEKNDIREYATEKLVMELLPVLDNFERALAASAEDDPAGYAKGMELIFTQMVTELQKSGLAEVEAEGQDFDPTKHNAVMTEENEELESGKVSKVLQKGYALNDKVIRPSMVAVTK